jgi:hypothetical protein
MTCHRFMALTKCFHNTKPVTYIREKDFVRI